MVRAVFRSLFFWFAKEYQAIVTIEDGIVKGELPRRALNLVYEWLDLHKNELMGNWKRLILFESPEPIKPLE